jgi:prevent-host-death family protein
MKKYSIAEARNQLTRLVREAESGEVVEIERRGAPVAVLVSRAAWQTMAGSGAGFFERLEAIRQEYGLDEEGIEADVWADVRDPDPGREVEL